MFVGLRLKCRYRKFVEGVFFDDYDQATSTADGEDNDDEDYVPPKNDIKRVCPVL